jgi:hypothetical protein
MVGNYLSITKMFGIELEFFVMNKKGEIVNRADSIIKPLKRKLTKTNITNESGQHMLEIMSKPNMSSKQTYKSLLGDMETLLYETDNNDLKLCNLGTYPSVNNGLTRTETRYQANEKIRGQGMRVANNCIGFHYHFSLPRGTFDRNKYFFMDKVNEIRKKKVVNLFNLFVALDPAVTTFMQSSPYYEGKYLGKSSRTMVYRSESVFNRPEKLFKNYPELSTLNEYSPNFNTLIQRIKGRANLWKQLLDEKGVNHTEYAKQDRETSVLDSSWKPVKISSHGTIESRGSDMNTFKNIISMTSVMNFLSRFVQRNKIDVIPSNIGTKEPFKLEDKKIYVPKHDYLKNVLQKNSALYGLEDAAIYRYSKLMIKLVKKITPIEARPQLKSFSKMLSERKTLSDDIIKRVKKIQGYSESHVILPETTKKIVINYSKKMYKDLLISKKMTEQNLGFY